MNAGGTKEGDDGNDDGGGGENKGEATVAVMVMEMEMHVREREGEEMKGRVPGMVAPLPLNAKREICFLLRPRSIRHASQQ